jgi:hypothetical protein
MRGIEWYFNSRMIVSEGMLNKYNTQTNLPDPGSADPELDGGWFRAFDFNRWEYWASNGDAGWGAWSIESGWTQSWITTVLGLRLMNTSIWDLTVGSNAEKQFEDLRIQMLPGIN